MSSSQATTKMHIRSATIDDCELILGFIRELAVYEKLEHELVATPQILAKTLFGDKAYAEVLIGEYEGEPVAYALYFHSFSTFHGRPGIYLEDVYVQPAMRGKGMGKLIMSTLAHIALERGCARFEWSVLDWNAPSIAFYRSIGAEPMEGWTVQRVSGKALEELAASRGKED